MTSTKDEYKQDKLRIIINKFPILSEFVEEEIDIELYEELAKKYILKYIRPFEETLITTNTMENHEAIRKVILTCANFTNLPLKTKNLCDFALMHNVHVIRCIPDEHLTVEMVLHAYDKLYECGHENSFNSSSFYLPKHISCNKEFLQQLQSRPYGKKMIKNIYFGLFRPLHKSSTKDSAYVEFEQLFINTLSEINNEYATSLIVSKNQFLNPFSLLPNEYRTSLTVTNDPFSNSFIFQSK